MRKMKDSGFSWLGYIPNNWDIKKVKHCFYRKNEKAMQNDPVILSLARSGVKVRDISNNEGQMAESYFNYNPVDIDDLLLNPMDLYSGANCSISKVKGVISPAYVNLRALDGINPVFFDYYFKVQYWLMAFFSYGKGVSFDNRWTLNAETLMNYPVIVPSYAEQCKIADYLDDKCSKIDATIAKQEKIIEKLNDYRKSVITDNVTGTECEGKRVNSGIKYVDSIPSHWENRKMLSILAMRVVDGPHESPELLEEGIPYISATAIEKGKIDFSKRRGNISEAYCDICDKRYKPRRDDILVIKLGASTGQVSIVETDERFNIWVPLAAVRCNEGAYPKFVYYAFQSDYFIRQMEQSWTYGTQQTLGVKTIEQLRVLLPPKEEQIEIANYLDQKCESIEKQVACREQLISKLTEYKKSLIYECVTGKKEVC